MKDRFRTKASRLTPYAFACGYIEQFEQDGKQVTLWHEGGPNYHVRMHDFNEHERVFWDTFTKLTLARKCFDSAKRQLKRKAS